MILSPQSMSLYSYQRSLLPCPSSHLLFIHQLRLAMVCDRDLCLALLAPSSVALYAVDLYSKFLRWLRNLWILLKLSGIVFLRYFQELSSSLPTRRKSLTWKWEALNLPGNFPCHSGSFMCLYGKYQVYKAFVSNIWAEYLRANGWMMSLDFQASPEGLGVEEGW